MRWVSRAGKFILVATLIIGISSIFLVEHLTATSRAHFSSKDQAVINRSIQIYCGSLVWGGKTHWLGIPSLQTPTDNWIMQEIIAKVRPDFIIETGTLLEGIS